MDVRDMNEAFYKIPLYCQLAEAIEDKIEKGLWKTGTQIPSERELSELYNMSRITVRKAIDELERQGKLEKIQGKGTFVLSPSIVQNLGNVYSFTNEMDKQGKISSTQLVTREIIPADQKLCEKLNIEEGMDVIYLERLRCADGNQPIMVEKTYFSKDRYPFVMDIDVNHVSLYQTLENVYGIVINQAVERFKACELTTKECKQLHCPKKQFGLLVKRTSYSNDQIICYSTIVSKGDIFEFTVTLGS